MISGYIDGFLCACPPPTATPEAFYGFVDGLLKWRELRGDRTVALYASSKTYDVLAETGRYPLWDPIAASLAAARINDVQAKDVVDLVHAFLTKAVAVEHVLGMTEFLYNDGSCQVPWASGVRPSEFDSLTQHLVVSMGLRRSENDEDHRRHVLLSRDCPNGSSVSVDAAVLDADGIGRDRFTFPIKVEGTFPLVSSNEGLWEAFDPGEICLHAMHEQKADLLAVAIAESVRRQSAGAGEWSMHPDFAESLWQLGGAHNLGVARAVIRACAETVLGQAMAATHHLRRGPGPTEPQRVRTRDRARAWRRDVDHEFHLHYWDTPQGPELAAVVAHANMSIPE